MSYHIINIKFAYSLVIAIFKCYFSKFKYFNFINRLITFFIFYAIFCMIFN
nr:MAG TPA: hypothetical protein [Caudoviricetes sp.]